MTADSRVSGEIDTSVDSDGLIVLNVRYSPQLMFQAEAFQLLSSELVNEYNKMIAQDPKSTSSVVVINASAAGSPLDKALFELYKEVEARSGQIIVVGYPADYTVGLNALGLPTLPGFSLANSRDEALSRL